MADAITCIAHNVVEIYGPHQARYSGTGVYFGVMVKLYTSILSRWPFVYFLKRCLKFRPITKCLDTDIKLLYYRIPSRTSHTFLAPNFSIRFRVRLVRQNKFWTFLKQFLSPRFWRQPTFFPFSFCLLSVINDNSTGNSTILTFQCIRQCCIKLIKWCLPLFGLKNIFYWIKNRF